MLLLDKRISDIGPDDIVRLIENAIPESKTLDFKRELRLEKESEKKELLNDIAALANSEGGVLVVGVDEKQDANGQGSSTAGSIVGFAVANQQQFKQRIEDLVYSSIEPRVSGLQIRFLQVGAKDVLLVSVERRIDLPHMVTLGGSNKFFRRNSTSKALMDVYELNQAFLESGRNREEVVELRRKRLEAVTSLSFDSSVDVSNPTFIQILPLGRVNRTRLDFSVRAFAEDCRSSMKPIMGGSGTMRYNLDGLMVYSASDKIIHSYVQLFRNGMVEYYSTQLHALGEKEYHFQGYYFERTVRECCQAGMELMRRCGIEPPYVVLLSILKMKGRAVVAGRHGFEENRITQDTLLLPEAIFENDGSSIDQALKFPFDYLWQASGYSGSPSYDATGAWVAKSGS
jgi:Putative DNA-binding domain